MYVYHRKKTKSCHLAFPFERDQRERERERGRWQGFGVTFAQQVTHLRAGAGALMVLARLPLPRSTTSGSTPPRSCRKRNSGPRSDRSQPIWPKTAPFMPARRVSRASQVCYVHSTSFVFVLLSSKFTNVYKYWKDYFAAVLYLGN
jgi:hypothetical protein